MKITEKFMNMNYSEDGIFHRMWTPEYLVIADVVVEDVKENGDDVVACCGCCCRPP